MEQEWTLPSSTVSKKVKQVRQTELISVSKGNKLWRKAPLKHLQAVRSPLCERTALPFKRHALSGIHSRTAAAHGNAIHGPPCTGTHPCPATIHGPTSTRPHIHAAPPRTASAFLFLPLWLSVRPHVFPENTLAAACRNCCDRHIENAYTSKANMVWWLQTVHWLAGSGMNVACVTARPSCQAAGMGCRAVSTH